jgi:hypothetical protein
MNDKPKELEEHSAKIFEFGCMERPVYLKEDVDAAIAELKRKLQDQCISCPVKMQEDDVVAELKADYREACKRLQTANLIKDEQIAATRHQKYKRCLAMAKWCRECSWSKCVEKFDFYYKWYNRWLEIAEQFKDKEAK